MKFKSNIFIAILLCALTCLGGSILFGIIYGIGYYVFIIPVLEVFLGAIVYQKLTRKSAINITVAILLSTALVVAFNIIAIVICEISFVAQNFSMSFSKATDTFFYYVKHDAEVNSAFNSTITSASLFTLVGAVAASIDLIISYKKENKELTNQGDVVKEKPKTSTSKKIEQKTSQKQKSNKPANNSKQTNNSTNVVLIEERLYNNLYNNVKQSLINLSQSKNPEVFKQEINNIKLKNIKNMPAEIKAKFILRNEKLLKTKQTKLAEQTLSTMNKLLK